MIIETRAERKHSPVGQFSLSSKTKRLSTVDYISYLSASEAVVCIKERCK